jgi:hypothetical protein
MNKDMIEYKIQIKKSTKLDKCQQIKFNLRLIE